MAPTVLGATPWLAVAATPATVRASWGLAQAVAKMKESATWGLVGVRFVANFDFQFSGHCVGSNPVVSFTKGFTYKRPHADGDLPLSC